MFWQTPHHTRSGRSLCKLKTARHAQAAARVQLVGSLALFSSAELVEVYRVGATKPKNVLWHIHAVSPGFLTCNLRLRPYRHILPELNSHFMSRRHDSKCTLELLASGQACIVAPKK
jgi:hypothetical protein